MRRSSRGRSERFASRHEPFPEFNPLPSSMMWSEDTIPEQGAEDVVNIAALSLIDGSVDEMVNAELQCVRAVVEGVSSLERSVVNPGFEPMEVVGENDPALASVTETAESRTAVGSNVAEQPASRSWYEMCLEEEGGEECQAKNSEKTAEQCRREMIAEREAEAEEKARVQREERERQRRQESERHATAAEARKADEGAWFGPGSHAAASTVVTPVPALRRPMRDIEATKRLSSRADGPASSTGAIRKHRVEASPELQESQQAEVELIEYLRSESPKSGSQKPTQRVSPARVESSRATQVEPATPWLPISSWPLGPQAWDLGQDEEVREVPRRANPSLPATENRLSSTRRPKKKRSKAYNPRRQLTIDDHYDAPIPRTPTPPLGPDSLVRRTAANVSASAVSSSNNARPERPVRTRGVAFGGLVSIPTDPRVDPPAYACFNCWQENHRAVDCSWPKRIYCHNCGRRGVGLTECPRCSEAHRQFLERKKEEERRLREREVRSVTENQRRCERCGGSTGTQRDCTRCESTRSGSRSSAENERRRNCDDAERRRRDQRDERVINARSRHSRSNQRVESSSSANTQRSVRDRLGPSPSRANTADGEFEEQKRDAIREALEIIQGIRDLPAETRDDVLSYLYSKKNRSPSRSRKRKE